jgi:hypothetical protein
MKALNNKERNSAIFRFALWLFICVLIICVPVIFSSFLTGEKTKYINSKSQDDLTKLGREARYEKDTLSVQIKTILELMKNSDSEKSKIETFNAELINIVKDIETQTASRNDWRGEMYKNISIISGYLIESNKILNEDRSSKDKQSDKLSDIIMEFETCGEEITNLCSEKNRRDFQSGIKRVDTHYKKAMKMLNSYK